MSTSAPPSRPRTRARTHSSHTTHSRRSNSSAQNRQSLTRSSGSKDNGVAAYYRACQIFPPSSAAAPSAPQSAAVTRVNSWEPPDSWESSPQLYVTRTEDPQWAYRSSMSSKESPAQEDSFDDSSFEEDLDRIETSYYNLPPVQLIDWKSRETREKEYAIIDKENRGLRKLWKKLRPSKASRGFYQEGDQNSDNDSVRRYRIE